MNEGGAPTLEGRAEGGHARPECGASGGGLPIWPGPLERTGQGGSGRGKGVLSPPSREDPRHMEETLAQGLGAYRRTHCQKDGVVGQLRSPPLPGYAPPGWAANSTSPHYQQCPPKVASPDPQHRQAFLLQGPVAMETPLL